MDSFSPSLPRRVLFLSLHQESRPCPHFLHNSVLLAPFYPKTAYYMYLIRICSCNSPKDKISFILCKFVQNPVSIGNSLQLIKESYIWMGNILVIFSSLHLPSTPNKQKIHSFANANIYTSLLCFTSPYLRWLQPIYQKS